MPIHPSLIAALAQGCFIKYVCDCLFGLAQGNTSKPSPNPGQVDEEIGLSFLPTAMYDRDEIVCSTACGYSDNKKEDGRIEWYQRWCPVSQA